MRATVKDLVVRLLAIGLRKYSVEPETRSSATRLMLANAMRLHIAHASKEDAARIALDVLSERGIDGGQA